MSLRRVSVLLLALAMSEALLWDETTVLELFPEDYTTYFPPQQKESPCMRQFSSFIKGLREKRHWARQSEYFVLLLYTGRKMLFG